VALLHGFVNFVVMNISDYILNPWVYWSLTVIYLVTVVSIIGVVLSENRNPLKSLAWVSVLLLFPVGGVALYIFFGRSIKNTHMISRRNRRRLISQSAFRDNAALPRGLSAEARQMAELGRSLAAAPLFTGNTVKAYHWGRDKFDDLMRDIESARQYINLQYYIIEDDDIGSRLAEALMRKASEGVRVCVIYDHIGSIHVKRKFFSRMRQAGVEVYPFFRVVFPLFGSRINWRNHRKICVIDGRIGYIGGMNVADRYIDGGKRFDRWRDTHLRVTGPAVAALQYSFAVDWSFMGHELLDCETSVDAADNEGADASMQLLTSGPTSEWSNVALQMLKAIGNAKKRIYLQTPYFLPTESLLRALQAAALARVDVRVMMPLHSDSLILTYASRSYILESLRAGIKIYLYRAGMLHSKVMIIDDDYSSVGSANIDFRSFEHNFESTLFVNSEALNRELTRQFELDQPLSDRVRLNQWRHRPMTQKALESIVRLLSPIL